MRTVRQVSKHLLGEPGAAGLSDPLPGVDAGVDPDGGTVASTSAELRHRKGEEQLNVNLVSN